MNKVLISIFLLLSTSSAYAVPILYPSGPQVNVSVTDITSGGWTECYAGTMAAHVTGSQLKTACAGDYVMMGGRQTGASTFLALASAAFDDVFFATTGNNLHLANGTNWYFRDNYSMGFTEANDSVSLNSCDISNSPLSMCLHLSPVGGYRINAITGLNNSSAYEKIFYVANDSGQVPVPAPLALMGLGLVAMISTRRKKA